MRFSVEAKTAGSTLNEPGMYGVAPSETSVADIGAAMAAKTTENISPPAGLVMVKFC